MTVSSLPFTNEMQTGQSVYFVLSVAVRKNLKILFSLSCYIVGVHGLCFVFFQGCKTDHLELSKLINFI